MLIPASAEDLRISGKMSPSVNLDLESKSVQVKVPVVATVTQIIDDSGNSSYKVEPPSDSEQDPGKPKKYFHNPQPQSFPYSLIACR